MLNDYYQNIGIKGFVKRYGFVNALRRGLFMAVPTHMVKDYEIKKILWQRKASIEVKKYLKYKDTDVEGPTFFKKDVGDVIWIYWNAGIENAPDIVKKCYASIKKYANREIILITDANLNEYMQFPEYIEKKRKTGQMSLASYSDLIRFALLEHYGGTWIDSTVYLTEHIPDEILSSDFFVLRNSLLLIDNPVLYPAWFLHAKKNNKTIKEICKVSFSYWRKNKHIIEYLLPNLIITQVLKADPEAEKKIPYMNSDYSEYLIKVLGDMYSKQEYDWIKKLTGIHKLSYKFDAEINKEGNFYRHLITDSF